MTQISSFYVCGSSRRPGVVSTAAMLYLVLFAALALGFYAATTTSAQVSRNERLIVEARLSAESGLEFMRYRLGAMRLPSNTNATNLMENVRAELARTLDGKPNMGGHRVRLTGGLIVLPDPSDHILLEEGGVQRRFRATIAQNESRLVVTIYGGTRDFSVTRLVQLKFQPNPRSSDIFKYGVATRGRLVTEGAAVIRGQTDPARGSVLSVNMNHPTPVVIHGKSVSGDISIANPEGDVDYRGASVGGTSNSTLIEREHIHVGVPAPEFPTVDTTEYAKYAVNRYVSGSKTLSNTFIPAGANPKFSGGTEINGVLYVKAPNRIQFSGNTVIRGVIVVENGAASDLVSNRIEFTGNTTVYGVETLPESYGDVRKLAGAFILAPNFAVNFGGSFGSVNGSIIASDVDFGGNAGGVINGSIINLNNTQMDVRGSSEIVIGPAPINLPPGVTFGTTYVPMYETFRELLGDHVPPTG